jgi:pSer/pThr/pTyr-binding forkhead associated (FHA) protein
MNSFPTQLRTCYNHHMNRPAKIRWPLVALLLMGIWIHHTWVSAQAGVIVRVSNLSTDRFPSISLSLTAIDDSGRHIPDLSPQNFTIIEDGEAININAVQETTKGTQQIFILNTSRGLRGRDALGLTRYDYVRSALIEWWGKEEAATIGMDDLNLMTVDGNLVMHTTSTAILASTLNAYEPTFEQELANFDLLLEALELSADPTTRQGKSSFIFFITPLITEPQDFPLANSIARAKENGITIYPILVGPEELVEYPQIDNLELLAETTGGELIFFDDHVGFDSLADRILTRRKIYEIEYTSKANTSGSHNLQVRITSDLIDVISEPTSFPINLATPEPIFVQPPVRITRETQDPAQPLESIPPTSTDLQILVTFPDGYPRDIVSSQLIIDNQPVSTNNEAPFDFFEWDLSGYTETGAHEIKALVEDSLGLRGSTQPLSITIEVITPPRGLNTLDSGLGFILIILGIVAIAGVLGTSIITIVRRRRQRTSSGLQETRAGTDQRQSARLFRKTNRFPAEAILEPVTGTSLRIPLVGTDLVLGRDASISAAQLDDPSVSALHARLIRLASGDYLIRDQGSVAGTWVNYQPIPERGKILRHGDLIHLGRVGLRFQLPNPPPEGQFRVKSVDSVRPTSSLEDEATRGSLDEQ